MRIVYIHGANSTSRSFSYLIHELPEFTRSFDLYYDAEDGLEHNVSKLAKVIRNHVDDEFAIIGHSLGGVIGAALTHRHLPVKKLITISSPFGGSRIAEWLSWTQPTCQLFKDIRISSRVLANIRKAGSTVPMLSFVTEWGNNSLFGEPNDGTVSVRSQYDIKADSFKHKKMNHFEVLLCNEVAQEIRDFLNDSTDR